MCSWNQPNQDPLGNLLEMQILGTHPDLLNKELLEWEQESALTKSPSIELPHTANKSIIHTVELNFR